MNQTSTRDIEDRLERALGPLRADPQEFRKAVETKIEERSAGQNGEEGSMFGFLVDRPLLARAAAMMPPGMGTGGVTGGSKVATWLLLPVLSLVMVAYSFTRAAMTMSKVARSQESTDGTADVREWWQVYRIEAAIALLVGAVMLALGWIELILVCVILSMGVFVYVVRQLSASGWITREAIGDQAIHLLSTMFVTVGLLAPRVSESNGALEIWIGGMVVCALLGRFGTGLWEGWKEDRARRFEISTSLINRVFVPIGGGLVVLYGSMWVVGHFRFQTTELPVSEWRKDLEPFPWQAQRSPAEAQDHWGGWAVGVEAFHFASSEPLDLGRPSAVARTQWEQERSYVELPREVFRVMAIEGLWTSEDWETVRRRETRGLWDETGPLEDLERTSRVLWSWVATDGLTDSQRFHLASRVEQTWPRAVEARALRDALTMTLITKHLDLPRWSNQRDAVIEIIRESQGRRGIRAFGDGGYRGAPSRGISEADTASGLRLLEWLHEEGVDVSDVADLSRISSYLRRCDAPLALRRDVTAEAGLHRLEALRADFSDEPWWLRRRIELGALAVILLCVFAQIRLPRVASGPARAKGG